MQNFSPLKICFVIMPFTVKKVDEPRYPDPNHWNEVYEGLIIPAVGSAGLQCERDDSDTASRLIAESILEKIEQANLILCDLSSHNANVFLELGWALRADKPFILIKDDLTDYAFDLNQQYIFNYSHSLQPIILREEISRLTATIGRTLNDSERRYSLIKKMSISLSAIKALDEGDFQAQILSDIQQRLIAMQSSGGISSPDVDYFPWRELLKQATSILFAVRDNLNVLGESPDQNEIISIMSKTTRKLGAYHNRDIQVSLIDMEKRWVYHDWQDKIGRTAGLQNSDRFLLDVFEYDHGAVAWVDKGTNVPRKLSLTHKRMNVAIFSTIGDFGWKVIVETHYETD